VGLVGEVVLRERVERGVVGLVGGDIVCCGVVGGGLKGGLKDGGVVWCGVVWCVCV
jgi:hypothetical protein